MLPDAARMPTAPPPSSTAAELLRSAQEAERAGAVDAAVRAYSASVTAAESAGELPLLSEALRRLAAHRSRRGEADAARELCQRSHDIARELGDQALAAEALTTMGCILIATGALESARDAFLEALRLGGPIRSIRARIEQNLGILANIQGALDEALAWYGRSLEEYRAADDRLGCAIAYNNLGMASADRALFDEADRYFGESRALAERVGDWHLVGLALANHAEVHAARQRYDDALACADESLRLFERIGARAPKSEAYRIIGAVYRDTGRPALAESRLRSAIDTAVSTGSVLAEAEASRELAMLYQTMGRNQEALALLNAAHRLFRRLDARVDLVNVDGKLETLQGTYLAVVRDWGQSIESSDSYTFGHCGRVADNAAAVAEGMGLDEQEVLTIRLGAYLHDLGKVRLPHEVLNKPGPLTDEEVALVRLHPVWGVELLAGIEFPWAITPIIRSHHEKYDGSGYPDRLVGDEVPLSAQIVGVADVYDALTTNRSYRAALSPEAALAEIARCDRWWSPAVHQAALRVFGGRVATRRDAGPARYAA
jgi:putative nucleotidyltransferase with HDIG domain